MKTFLILILTVVASISFAAPAKTTTAATPATAAAAPRKAKAFTREYGLAGCGLGSVVMGRRGGQVSAGTTNGTLFNQMIGITAGTLNCVDTPSSEVAGRIDQFILVNRSQIQGDVARGNGETLVAISSYMGCENSSGQVASQLKSNYSEIFSSEAAANEITDSIITTILNSPALAQKCTNLG